MRPVGSGSRSMEVVYHQNGKARRIRRGNERVTRRRNEVEGLSLAVIADGRGRVLGELWTTSGTVISQSGPNRSMQDTEAKAVA